MAVVEQVKRILAAGSGDHVTEKGIEMRYIEELYQAAGAVISSGQAITGDLHGRNPQVDSYDVSAEAIERLRDAMGQALKSIESLKRRHNVAAAN